MAQPGPDGTQSSHQGREPSQTFGSDVSYLLEAGQSHLKCCCCARRPCGCNKTRLGCCLLVVVLSLAALLLLVLVFQKTLPPAAITYSSDPDTRLVQILQDYIKVDTAHPAPDYEGALSLLADVAAMYDFEHHRIDTAAGPLLIVSWRSPSDTESLVLLSHMDVVAAEQEGWKFPPFAGHLDPLTGNIYGRGTQDMKSVGVQYIEALHRLRQSGWVPSRTIHVIYEADEEISGSSVCDEDFLRSDEWNQMNVVLTLDEGIATGMGKADSGDLILFYAQRTSWWFSFEASGPAGHGSLMHNRTASMKLSEFLADLLELRSVQEARWNDGAPLGMVTTINPTWLGGGSEVAFNVVPASVSMGFDVRITPSEFHNVTETIRALAAKAGGTIMDFQAPAEWPESPHSEGSVWWSALNSTLTEYLSNMTTATRAPLAIVRGEVFPAGSSGPCLRKRGIPVYGFSPMPHTPRLLHDYDEFIHNETLVQGVEIYETLLRKLDLVASGT